MLPVSVEPEAIQSYQIQLARRAEAFPFQI